MSRRDLPASGYEFGDESTRLGQDTRVKPALAAEAVAVLAVDAPVSVVVDTVFTIDLETGFWGGGGGTRS